VAIEDELEEGSDKLACRSPIVRFLVVLVLLLVSPRYCIVSVERR
jgi:hypothetical protein